MEGEREGGVSVREVRSGSVWGGRWVLGVV